MALRIKGPLQLEHVCVLLRICNQGHTRSHVQGCCVCHNVTRCTSAEEQHENAGCLTPLPGRTNPWVRELDLEPLDLEPHVDLDLDVFQPCCFSTVSCWPLSLAKVRSSYDEDHGWSRCCTEVEKGIIWDKASKQTLATTFSRPLRKQNGVLPINDRPVPILEKALTW